MKSLLAALLLLAGCNTCSPLGMPEPGRLGTTADGDSVIGWFQENLCGEYTSSTGAFIDVSATGQQRSLEQQPPLLAADCSDQPGALGACVPADESGTADQPLWTYVLDGGDQILATTNGLSRVSTSGMTEWKADGTCMPSEPIRGTTLLTATCLVDRMIVFGAELLDVDSGQPIWTVQAPDHL
jgi:hypothetical protein